MSHPGNDEIIDNERDKRVDAVDPKRYALINEMVHHATKMGIGVVQEIAAATVKRKPGMSVKDFVKILDDYIEKQEELKNSH